MTDRRHNPFWWLVQWLATLAGAGLARVCRWLFGR